VSAIRGNNATGAARPMPLNMEKVRPQPPKEDPVYRQTGCVATLKLPVMAINLMPETDTTTREGSRSTILEVRAAERGLYEVKHWHDVLPAGLVRPNKEADAALLGPGYGSHRSPYEGRAEELTRASGHKHLPHLKLILDVRLAGDVAARRDVIYSVDVVAVESRDGAPTTGAEVDSVEFKVYFTAGFADDWPAPDPALIKKVPQTPHQVRFQQQRYTMPLTRAPRGSIPEASLALLEEGAAGWAASILNRVMSVREELLDPVRFDDWVPALEAAGIMPFLKSAFSLPSPISSTDHPACTSLFGTVKTRDAWGARVVAPAVTLPAGWQARRGPFYVRYLRRTAPVRGEALAAQFMLSGPEGGIDFDHYRVELPRPGDEDQDMLASRGYRRINLSVKLVREGVGMAAVVKLDDVRATSRSRLHTAWVLGHASGNSAKVLEQLEAVGHFQTAEVTEHLPGLLQDMAGMVLEAVRGALVAPSITLREVLMMGPLDRVLRGAYAGLARGGPGPAPQDELRMAALDVVAHHFLMARPYDPVLGGLRRWATLPPAVFPASNEGGLGDVPPQEDLGLLHDALLAAALGEEEDV